LAGNLALNKPCSEYSQYRFTEQIKDFFGIAVLQVVPTQYSNGRPISKRNIGYDINYQFLFRDGKRKNL